MIYLYSGTPGSGKSMHVAKDIMNRLNYQKRPVIANFDINLSIIKKKARKLFEYVPNKDLEPDYLYLYAGEYWHGKRVIEDSILLVIDEAQLIFNSRNWSNQQRMDWIEFFSQHRHYGYKVVLIAQNDRMIDRQIRSLLEIEVIHRKLGNAGFWGKLLTLPFRGKLFIAVSHYYGLNEKVGSNWMLPNRKAFRLYDSYNRFEQVK